MEVVKMNRSIISCYIPTEIWEKTKLLAEDAETTATNIVIDALEQYLDDIKMKTSWDVGDRVAAEDWDGIEYTNFQVCFIKDIAGIYTRDGIAGFRTLSSFKNIEKLN